MYSPFLTRCPTCATVLESPRIHLHSTVTCARCFQVFTAEENYVDIEETFVSNLKPVEDKDAHSKGLGEGMTTHAAVKVEFDDFARPTSFSLEEHYKGRLDWTLVSSTDLQEGTETIGADKEASNDNVRSASFKTSEHGREKPVAVTKLNEAPAKVSIKEVGFRQEESKTAPGGCKSKKRKLSQSLTWGIALRKPSREKRKVKSYSPSYEAGFRKRGKLGLVKGHKVSRCDLTAAKVCRMKGGDVEKQFSGRNQRDFLDGGVSTGKATTEGTTGKPSKLHNEAYFEEFKDFLTAEIKRQLGGLGEESKRPVGEIQVVDVEEVLPQTPNSVFGSHDALAEGQQFIAKVRVMATIFIPITLHASEHSPAGSPGKSKSRENSEDELEGREVNEEEHKGKEGKDESKDREAKEDQPKDREGRDELKGRGVKEDELKDTEGKDASKGRNVKADEPKGTEGTEDEPQNMELEPKEALESDRSSADEPLFKDGNKVDVPASEYYDFNFNRSEDKFAPGQIWAFFDNSKDVMPRDYLQIKKVVSIKPFKVHIAFLEPAGGSPISCGEFRIVKGIRVMDDIDGISHMMRSEEGQSGIIHIYPTEKEVWALYKNWREIDLNRRIKAGYDIVKIVAVKGDLTVSVIPLLHYKGSRTVFQKADVEPFEIHKKDSVRFSHQIATYEIIGYAGGQDCLELDPAAIPSY